MNTRWLPPREKVLQSRWLRPFARHLDHDGLWRFEREPVARGLALGLFFGLLLPVAQCLFAVLLAVVWRANVPVATAATLVTNPLTVPPIYWLAWQLGSRLLHEPGTAPAPGAALQRAAQEAAHPAAWLDALLAWVQATGVPLLAGLLLISLGASLLGYLLAHLLWRLRRS